MLRILLVCQMKITRTFLLGLLFLLLGILALTFLVGESLGKTITVDDSGGSDHRTIQDAVEAAESGDTIDVEAGRYYGKVSIDKKLILQGKGPETTVIDRRSKNTHFELLEDDIVISNFSFDGNPNGIGLYSRGERTTIENSVFRDWKEGVRVSNYKQWNIRNCSFLGNRYGVFLATGISNSYFTGNIFQDNWMAIFAHNQAIDLMIRDGTFDSNTLVFSEKSSASTVRLNSVIFYKNHFVGNERYLDGYEGQYSFFQNTFEGSPLPIRAPDNADNKNTLNGKPYPILFNDDFDKKSPEPFEGMDSFIATDSSNFIIRDLSISGAQSEIIALFRCSNIVIENVSFLDSGSSPVLYLESCTNILIANSSFILGDTGILSISGTGFSLELCHFGNYEGEAVSHSGSGLSLKDCYFENNSQGISYSGNEISLKNCYFENNTQGIYDQGSSNSNILDCDFYYNQKAIEVRGNPGRRRNRINFCNFESNSEYGIRVDGELDEPFLCWYNWWGAKSGPYHSTNNSHGRGDEVSDHVLFDSWHNVTILRQPWALILSISPEPTLSGKDIIFTGISRNPATRCERYIWKSSIDGEIYNGSSPSFSSSELSNGTHLITFSAMSSSGIWSEDAKRIVRVNGKPYLSSFSVSPKKIYVGIELHFSAEGIDDGEVRAYSWTIMRGETIFCEDEAVFSLDDLEKGRYHVFCQIKDDEGVWSENLSMKLLVQERLVAKIWALTPGKVKEGETVRFLGGSTDPDAFLRRYVWFSTLDGEIFNGSSAEFISSELSPGKHFLTFRVQNASGVWSEQATATLVVEDKEDEFFLLKKVGPLPLVAYLVLIALALGAVAISTKKSPKSDPGKPEDGAQASQVPNQVPPPQTPQPPPQAPAQFQAPTPQTPQAPPPPPVQNQVPPPQTPQPPQQASALAQTPTPGLAEHGNPPATMPGAVPQQLPLQQQSPVTVLNCAHCGKPPLPGARFCTGCGAKRE